jgi:hypothetical protein
LFFVSSARHVLISLRFALVAFVFQYFFPRGVIRSISFLSQVNVTSVNSNKQTNKQAIVSFILFVWRTRTGRNYSNSQLAMPREFVLLVILEISLCLLADGDSTTRQDRTIHDGVVPATARRVNSIDAVLRDWQRSELFSHNKSAISV